MTDARRAKGFSPDERAFAEDGGGQDLSAIQPPGCPAPSLLAAAAMGALPDDLARPVLAHLRDCGICRQVSSDLLELETEMDPLREVRILRRVTERRRAPVWRMAAVAASVVIALGGALAAGRAANPGTIPTAVAPPRASVAPPAVAVLRPVKLEPRMDSSLLVWRGAGDRFALDLATALKPYAANNFKAAVAALERLATQYPNRAEPVLYLGVCRLLMDRPVEAETALRRAASLDSPVLEDARWYLAVATYQNGRRAEARQLLAAMCRANGARAAEACVAHDQTGEPQ